MPGLISTPGQIWLSAAPVDLRRGIDGLSALVQQALGQQPCAGSAFVFRNACGNRIKVLLWDGNIVFDYRGGRSGEHARQFLGSWQGHLMVDDYGGYKALFIATRQDPCIELGCWAHARRKFFDLHQANGSPMALEALTRIGQLYPIEQQGKALSSEARLQLRMEQSQPVLNALHEWLIQTCIKTAKGGGSAKALDYTLKRWPALIRQAETGHLPIDNNPVENTIRPIALGKKNWLFAGFDRAGQRAAAIQTLLGTAKLNGIDPAAWLRDTLEQLPTWPNSRIDELLPLARPVEEGKGQDDKVGD